MQEQEGCGAQSSPLGRAGSGPKETVLWPTCCKTPRAPSTALQGYHLSQPQRGSVPKYKELQYWLKTNTSCRKAKAVEASPGPDGRGEWIFYPEGMKNSVATIRISTMTSKSHPCTEAPEWGLSYNMSQFSKNNPWMKRLHGAKGRAGEGLMLQTDRRSTGEKNVLCEARGSVSIFCSAQSLTLSPWVIKWK